ncbi:MAG: S1 RNA-binding domain-containing protein [Ruminococcus sp.]|nr:S1 RNA-binding domain-containing protein [Ruminococcus sp.]
MSEYLPEGKLILSRRNREIISDEQLLTEAIRQNTILEARAALCDSNHNLSVELGCMKGIIPREEGALGIRDGSVRDIAVISRVNRPVCFTVTGIITDESGEKTAILSRENAQRICMESYISKLRRGDVINARVTHLENFGAFADIGCGIAALLPIDSISVSRIEHPRERFYPGMDIKAVVKSIENGRISLSHKELLGTWEENAAAFSPGETVTGIIRSVENYGAFVELAPNLAGLAESKENLTAGMQASVYIKSILPDKMKIKLIIIDTFKYNYNPQKPKYFYSGNHMKRFLYSPEGCRKVVETVFD